MAQSNVKVVVVLNDEQRQQLESLVRSGKSAATQVLTCLNLSLMSGARKCFRVILIHGWEMSTKDRCHTPNWAISLALPNDLTQE